MLHLYTTLITLSKLLVRAVMKRAMWVVFDNRAVFDTRNDRGMALY
jgi:hypothetical protein